MTKELVYLVQTDTTAGFLSYDDKKLAKIKQRPLNQKILQTVDSFDTLKKNTRVPQRFKNLVRRSKNTTFIYPNQKAFRVVSNDSNHHKIMKKFKKIFSTSANKTGEEFDLNFALNSCDVVIEDKNNFICSKSSHIIKLNTSKSQFIR
jgi:tRNA A37 threonylcarbamoyladenosine synthetase subunit TsaC/SUA5/YrdC